jgi:hypothetical protein
VLLIQPTWVQRASDLPPSAPDVLHQWPEFLEGVAQWIRDLLRSKSSLDGLIVDAIRSANLTWGGVGVYTVVELMARAGLHFYSDVF